MMGGGEGEDADIVGVVNAQKRRKADLRRRLVK